MTLLSAAPTLLPGFPARARRALACACAARGVTLLTDARAVRVDREGVDLADGRRVEADIVLWTTSAEAPAWPGASGLAIEDGYVLTDDALRSVSHPFVFAAGDVATMRSAPRSKAGVWAVRAGPPLAENLLRVVTAPHGDAPRLALHRPRREGLAILSTGPKHAVAVYGPLVVSGEWAWAWKDQLDRSFVHRFNNVAQAADRAS